MTQEASGCDLWLDSPVHVDELHFFKGRSLERCQLNNDAVPR
jgi:hypothetical protein